MSHELRTPLNTISGFSETLDQEIFGVLANDKQKGCVKDIHSSGQHLLQIINDILDVSAIEARKMELQKTELDVINVADEAILIVKPRAKKGSVNLQNQIDGAGLKLFADERCIKQIFFNLLSTTVKF